MEKVVYHYAELIRLRPASAEAHYRLGMALVKQGKMEEPAREFEIALRLQPGFPEAQRALDDITSQSQRSTPGRNGPETQGAQQPAATPQ